jgi:hypothetical protein
VAKLVCLAWLISYLFDVSLLAALLPDVLFNWTPFLELISGPEETSQRSHQQGMFHFVQATICVDDMCLPSTTQSIMYGAADPGSCDTLLDSIDNNLDQDIFIAGRTQSQSLISGSSVASCLDPVAEGYAGYVTRFDNGVILWNRFIFGNFFETPGTLEQVIKLPWVGLSRSAAAFDTTIYTEFVGFLVKMTTSDYIGMMSA